MAVKIFFCYAHEDEYLLIQLQMHLRPLEREGLIEFWYDRNISAGTEWEREISEQLNTAQIVLLLVSPDFMNSDYCYAVEMKQAIQRYERNEACVIPVILRPVYWQIASLRILQALPTDAQPIVDRNWHTLDEAFYNVTEGVRRAVEEIIAKQRLEEGNTLLNLKRYEEALEAYEQAILLNPHHRTLTVAYNNRGATFSMLERTEEALEAYEQAIRFDPNNTVAYKGKAATLDALSRYQEALTVCDQAICLDPNYAVAYITKGNVLNGLERYEEALEAFEQAIRFDPDHMPAKVAYYNNKATSLTNLGRLEEARQAREKAQQLC